jgi:hypothetical protein
MTALILLFLSFLKLHFKQIQQTTMSRIQQQPHSYRSGNIPLRFIRPLLDHRGVPTKLHTAIGRAPKEIEDCHICLEEIRFGQTRAIATPCCDHYVHLSVLEDGNANSVAKSKISHVPCVDNGGILHRYVCFASGIEQRRKPARCGDSILKRQKYIYIYIFFF